MDDLFKGVARASVPWLEYQELSGRGMLLGESYLAQPIGEQLRLAHEKVLAEFNHPIIVSPGRGRPRQVDYVVLGKINDDLVAGLEVKWVGETALPKQRLVDDLLRLECLRARPNSEQSAARYFMVAGRCEHIAANFFGLECNTQSNGRAPFVPLLLADAANPEMQVDIKELPAFTHKYFKSFEQSYNVESPTRLRTRLMDDVVGPTFRALVWKVDSGVGQRATFKAVDLWSTEAVPPIESDDE